MREITLEMELAAKKHKGSRTDLEKLWKVIQRYNVSEYELSRITGIRRTTLHRKLNGEGRFNLIEMMRLTYSLNLSQAESWDIFIAGYLNMWAA